MRLFQIPFSHNCVKARHVLELKGLEYDTVDINPAIRSPVRKVSDQPLVPALVDGDHNVAGSTAILLYLEDVYPEPPLLPEDEDERAESLLLVDWADAVFMALTRRLAYSSILSSGNLGQLFFPTLPRTVRAPSATLAGVILRLRFGISKRSDRRDIPEAKRAAAVALERLGGRAYLVGDHLTLADVTLAAMVGLSSM